MVSVTDSIEIVLILHISVYIYHFLLLSTITQAFFCAISTLSLFSNGNLDWNPELLSISSVKPQSKGNPNCAISFEFNRAANRYSPQLFLLLFIMINLFLTTKNENNKRRYYLNSWSKHVFGEKVDYRLVTLNECCCVCRWLEAKKEMKRRKNSRKSVKWPKMQCRSSFQLAKKIIFIF